MKLSIASDHAGFRLKTQLADFLRAQGHELLDHGAESEASCDYPDFARAVAADVASGAARFGVLVCSSGIGVSIAANRVRCVRAAVCLNEDIAEFSRRHNDANIICLGQKYVTTVMAEKFLRIFLATDFEGGRHQRRVEKIEG
ncbi:MAG: ribose 5-phosphate isomerase B [Puniceicoccales bacterium]|jgi:ribose 5-phosphate isomerase B|nr:ribose 5-phosphate isomerase B [Puniceicoccales bacterium]